MSWEEVNFSNLYAAPSRNGVYKSKEFHGSGYKIVNMGELFGFDFIGNQDMQRLQLTDRELEKNALEDGDLLFGRRSLVEAGAGKCSLVVKPNDTLTFESSIIRVRLDKEEVEPRFYFYYFASPQGRGRIRSLVTGTNVKGIRGSELQNLKVIKPSVSIQRKIAAILSAYDDLIENNLKRIRLLEESARLVFREWFVRLRFPGHEHTRSTDGVPEGWEKKPLAELCESVNYGYTASAQQENIGAKFLRITDIVPSFIDWSSVPYCEVSEKKKEQFLLKEGDIVVARTGATVGYAKRMHKRHPETVFASYLVRLRLKKEIDNLMVGVFVESDDYKNYIQAHVGGAAQPNANAKVISGAPFLVPPPHIQTLFRETVEASFDQRELLQIQNQKLKQARDLLLPRLMSGDLPV